MPRYATEAEWLAGREDTLGASEVAAAINMNPWCSQYRQWAINTGRFQQLQTEAFVIAHRMEPVIKDHYLWKHDGRRTVTNPGRFTTKAHPQLSFLRATPDYYQNDPDKGRGVLEVKTTGHFMAGEWVDSAPLHYQIQVQVQMACSGCQWGTIAALIDNGKFVQFDVKRNDAFIDSMLEMADRYWTVHVIGGEPPHIDHLQSTLEVIMRMHPKDNGETIGLVGHDWAEIVVAYDFAKEGIKKLQKERDELANKIRAGIGDASFADVGDGTGFSLKWWEREGHTVGPSQGRTLRRTKPKKG